MSLVQRFLFYSNDWRWTRCPSEFSLKNIFTELGRVHSSPTWANNFKSSLLQSLKYLQNIKSTSSCLSAKMSFRNHKLIHSILIKTYLWNASLQLVFKAWYNNYSWLHDNSEWVFWILTEVKKQSDHAIALFLTKVSTDITFNFFKTKK